MTPERLKEITRAAEAEAERECQDPVMMDYANVHTWKQDVARMHDSRRAYAAALVKSAVRAEVLLEVLHDLRHGSFDSEQAVNDRIDAALHAFKNPAK